MWKWLERLLSDPSDESADPTWGNSLTSCGCEIPSDCDGSCGVSIEGISKEDIEQATLRFYLEDALIAMEDQSYLADLTKNLIERVRNVRIEKLAYWKWEQAGKPEGQSDHFWNEAASEYDAEMERNNAELERLQSEEK